MQELPNIITAVNAVQNVFGKEYGRMDFLFTHRKGTHRTVLMVLRSLPGLQMRVTNAQSPDIAFESTWVADPAERQKHGQSVPRVASGWMDAAQSPYRPNYNYLAHTFTHFRKVREIAIFDYGFEVMAGGKMEMVAVKSIVWRDPSVDNLQSMIGEEFKGIRLCDGVDDELKMTWRSPAEIERRMQIEHSHGDFANIGQNKRTLLLDTEDV